MESVCIDSAIIRRCFPFDENTTTTPEAIADRLWGGFSLSRQILSHY
jgi:hypothetical protein